MTLRKLADSLEGWTPQGRGSGDPLFAIATAWAVVVGEKVAANAVPVQIERGALSITVRSAVWSQQLAFLSEEILAAIRARFPEVELDRLRLHVGKLPAPAIPRSAARPTMPMGAPTKRPKARDVAEAITRFRTDVEAHQRAKRAAGWKECRRCGALIAPRTQAWCVVCANARDGARAGAVARLLFDVPWLGYQGVASQVDGLTRDEYERIRKRLLGRWWDTLVRAGRNGRLSGDGRERLIASSYVLLKSGVSPDLIVPATQRNLLGDAIYELIYGMEPTTRHVE